MSTSPEPKLQSCSIWVHMAAGEELSGVKRRELGVKQPGSLTKQSEDPRRPLEPTSDPLDELNLAVI